MVSGQVHSRIYSLFSGILSRNEDRKVNMLDFKKDPSDEQKHYVASVCPEYEQYAVLVNSYNYLDDEVNCEKCIHWEDGECKIFDEILTNIDQT
ncbi:MAG TPA: hypothetical protein GX392_00105 [Clostridiales bacterium]|nr:hypothetical protein [Clostridiales bacterium]